MKSRNASRKGTDMSEQIKIMTLEDLEVEIHPDGTVFIEEIMDNTQCGCTHSICLLKSEAITVANAILLHDLKRD
jgi:hypothetical protein